MQELPVEHWPAVRSLLRPEAPCELIPHHPICTGLGRCWVDRWPSPGCAILFTGGNMSFAGRPSRKLAEGLAPICDALLREWDRVIIDPPPEFEALVTDVFDAPLRWARVLYEDRASRPPAATPAHPVRRLAARDTDAVAGLSEDLQWISDTLEGPAGLAASGTAFGVFVRDALVSVAVPFYVGLRFEELGVVTEAAQRGRGLSPAAARAVMDDIRARGRTPCWSTTPDNLASRRVAEKLGFRELRDSVHYVIGAPEPPPPTAD